MPERLAAQTMESPHSYMSLSEALKQPVTFENFFDEANLYPGKRFTESSSLFNSYGINRL